MNFEDWLCTATKQDGMPLSIRTVNHYKGGLETVSKEMYTLGVINKGSS